MVQELSKQEGFQSNDHCIQRKNLLARHNCIISHKQQELVKWKSHINLVILMKLAAESKKCLWHMTSHHSVQQTWESVIEITVWTCS